MKFSGIKGRGKEYYIGMWKNGWYHGYGKRVTDSKTEEGLFEDG